MKKLTVVFFALLFPQIILAAGIMQYDTKTGYCLQYLGLQNEFNFMDNGNAKPGFMIFTDQTQMTVEQLMGILKNTPAKYLKKNGDPSVAAMSLSEQKGVDGNEDLKIRKQRKDNEQSRYKNDLVIHALIQIISEIKQTTPESVQAEIDGIIKAKLKLVQ